MADVAIRAVGTPVGVDSTQITPTIPAGTQVGDLMIALLYNVSNSGTWQDLTGWTKDPISSMASGGCWGVFTRVYQSGDGSPTFTANASDSIIGLIFSLYNFDTSAIFDVACAASGFAAPASPYDVTIASFNTNNNGALGFLCWGSADDNTWVYQSGGGTQQVSFDNTAGGDNSICIATKPMPTAGATGDQVARQTNKAGDAGRILWFAVKPAGVAGQNIGGTVSSVSSIALTPIRLRVGLYGAVATITQFHAFLRCCYMVSGLVSAGTLFTNTGIRCGFRFGGSVSSVSRITLGSLRLRMAFGGIVDCGTDLAAGLCQVLHLVGSVVCSTATSCALRLYQTLRGAVASVTSVLGGITSGAVSVVRYISGLVISSTFIAGNMFKRLRLGGTVICASGASVALQLYMCMTGAVTTVTSTAGRLKLALGVSGTVSSLTSIMGRLKLTLKTGGTIACVSMASVAVRLYLLVAGAIVTRTVIVGNVGGIVQRFLGGIVACGTAMTEGFRLVLRIGGTVLSVTSLIGGSVSGIAIRLIGGVVASLSFVELRSIQLAMKLRGTVASNTVMAGALQLVMGVGGGIVSTTLVVASALKRIFLAGIIRVNTSIWGYIVGVLVYVSGIITCASAVLGGMSLKLRIGGVIVSVTSFIAAPLKRVLLAGGVATITAISVALRMIMSVGGAVKSATYVFCSVTILGVIVPAGRHFIGGLYTLYIKARERLKIDL